MPPSNHSLNRTRNRAALIIDIIARRLSAALDGFLVMKGKDMLHTSLCDLLNIEVPIICAPMGPNITSLELAAAVSNAGGLGIISFGGYPPPLLRREIRRLRSLTTKPFGVNLLLEFPVEEHVNVCLDEQVPVLSFFWGDPSPYIERAHAAGIKVIDQVGSVEAARRSVGAGVDAIIAQGVEA